MKDLSQLITYWSRELADKPDIIPEAKQAFIADTITALKQQGKLIDALRTFALTTNSVMLGKNLD